MRSKEGLSLLICPGFDSSSLNNNIYVFMCEHLPSPRLSQHPKLTLENHSVNAPLPPPPLQPIQTYIRRMVRIHKPRPRRVSVATVLASSKMRSWHPSDLDPITRKTQSHHPPFNTLHPLRNLIHNFYLEDIPAYTPQPSLVADTHKEPASLRRVPFSPDRVGYEPVTKMRKYST